MTAVGVNGEDGLLGATGDVQQVATLGTPRCQRVIDSLGDPLGIGGELLHTSQQLPSPGEVRRIQSAMLVTELLGHPVVVVEHVGPHVGTDRSRLDE